MENLVQRPLYDFLEHFSDGFIALDKNWRYVYINRRGAEIIGRKPEDVIGRHIWTEFPDAIDKPFYHAYHRALEEQVPIQIEEYYPPWDRWFENRIYPFPEGLAIFFTDITQRKETEKALEQERKTAQNYLNVANMIMLVIGKDQRVSLINKKGCQILGYREEEIIGKDWVDNFLPQGTRADIKDAFSRVLAGELPAFEYYENPILTKNGEERLIAWHNTLLTDEGGNITGTLSSGEDITERKEAEKLLQERENVLRLFVEHSPASLAMFDRDMRYIVASRRFLADYNLGEQDVVGRSHYEVFPEMPERWKEIHRRCLAGAIERCEQDPFPRADGRLDWVRWEIRPWYETSGNIGGIILFSEVITERKNIEESLQESESKFRAIIEASPVPYALNDDQQNVTYLNAVFVKTFGYNIDDIPTLADWWPRAYPDAEYRQWVAVTWQERLEKAKQTGAPFEPVELNIRCKDGTQRTVIAGAVPLGETFKGVHLVILYDITERKQAEAALRESDARWHHVLDGLGPHMFVGLMDVQGVVLLANRPALTAAGLRLEDVQGQPVADTWWWSYSMEVQTRLRAAVERAARGEPVRYDEQIRVAEGQFIWIDFSIQPLRDETGHVSFLIPSAQVITERKQAEEALQKSEERFRSIASHTPDHIIMQDRNLHYQAVINPQLGLTEADMIGKTDQDLLGKEDAEKLTVIKRQVIESGVPVRLEVQLQNAKGEDEFFEGSYIPKLDANGQPDGVIGYFRNITERKQAEEEIRTINEELRAINRIIVSCSTVLDLKQILNKVMDEALRITGLEGGTVCLTGPDETLHLAAQIGASEATIQDLTTHAVKIGDCLCGTCARDHASLILPDRESVLQFATRESTRGEDFRFHAAFPLMAAGKCTGVLCVFTRTDHKPTERSLKLLETITAQVALAIDNARLYEETAQHAVRLEETVRERTAELEQANLRLKELDRLKSMFIASMSHELRTPLNSIIGFTGIILMGMSGEISGEQRKQLSIVQKSARHLLELITDVIDVSRIEAEKVELYLKEFDLSSLLREVMDSFAHAATEKGLRLSLEAPEKLIVRSDERRIKQVLNNLLSNAIKFTDKGGVETAVLDAEGRITIRVRDTGIGIKSGDQENLFKAFSKFTQEGVPRQEGTGLGLYLSRKIAGLLGGELQAESEFGKGSTFTFEFPKTL